MHITKAFCLTYFFILITSSSCGGGGGGNSYIGAAIVNVDTQPTKIDPGNRTFVKIGISDIHPNGILLKIRFPVGLKYATQTASLNVDGKKSVVNPIYNLKSSDEFIYLVFVFSQEIFGKSNLGTLNLQLEGVSEIKDGKIEVDPDVDDPTIPNNMEFTVANPTFSSEAETKIKVIN